MTGIRPSSHGIVVDHKESGTRYAVSDKNYNEKVHKKVRDLRPGETVLGYRPKRRSEGLEAGSEAVSGTSTQDGDANASSGSSDPSTGDSAGSGQAGKTEGSAPADAKGK